MFSEGYKTRDQMVCLISKKIELCYDNIPTTHKKSRQAINKEKKKREKTITFAPYPKDSFTNHPA